MKYKNIPEMLIERFNKTPFKNAHFSYEDGEWIGHTWNDYYLSSIEIAKKLYSVGLRSGDNIAIISPTSLMWEYAHMGILIAGGAIVGIDPEERQVNINKNIDKSCVTGLVVKNVDFIEKIDKKLLTSLKFIVFLEGESDFSEENFYLLKRIEGQNLPEMEIKENHPATIIFTSGTTGEQKSILYNHGQVLSASLGILNVFSEVDDSCKLACWLPLANLFQRMINFCAIEVGATNYFVEDPKKIGEFLPYINPDLFIGVPRIFEKIYFGIENQIEKKGRFVKSLFHFALNRGEVVKDCLRKKRKPPLKDSLIYKFLDHLFLKKIRQVFGNNLRYMISGSAPMPLWLLRKFHSLGFLVLESYGVSENIIPNAMNSPEEFRFGTVGKPLRENHIKIGSDGEVLVKGPGLFSGYLDNKEGKTPFDNEGFFPTGDYGEIDKDGYLSLTGRKSEIFKLSTGRKIVPLVIESSLNEIPYVDQAVIYGAYKKFLICILSFSDSGFSREGFLRGTESLNKVEEELLYRISSLPKYQRPVGFIIKLQEFSPLQNELTSNMKLRRKAIEENYKSEINKLYQCIENDQLFDDCIKGKNFNFLII